MLENSSNSVMEEGLHLLLNVVKRVTLRIVPLVPKGSRFERFQQASQSSLIFAHLYGEVYLVWILIVPKLGVHKIEPILAN